MQAVYPTSLVGAPSAGRVSVNDQTWCVWFCLRRYHPAILDPTVRCSVSCCEAAVLPVNAGSKASAAETCQRVNFLRGLQESCEECRVSFPCCGGMDDASPPAKPRPTPSSDRQEFVCLESRIYANQFVPKWALRRNSWRRE